MGFVSWLKRGVVRRRSLRRSKEWRPAAAARTAPRGARDPVPPGFGPAADRPLRRSGATAGAAGAGPRPKIATVERREGSRSHRGMVVAPRTRDARQECACRRSIHPSFGVQWDCCCRDCRQGYGGLYTEASGKAGANRTDKPGAHKRAAGRKKTALFDIVSLRPWPTVRFARREFARSCPGRAKRDPGHDLTAQSRAPASPCRTSARHGRSNASPRNRRRHRRESRTR